MATVSDIIDALGGYARVATEIDAPATTVHTWKRTGYVPRWRIPALVDLASRKKVHLAPEDFPSEKPATEARAA